MTMAARKLPVRSKPEPDQLTPFNMRMPESLIASLDAWVEELNEGRTLGRISRSDLIRAALEHACRARPNLEAK